MNKTKFTKEENNLERKSLTEIIRSPRGIGTIETLIGAGLIGLSFIPEIKELEIPLYVGATYFVADGVADIISNRYDFLWQETKQLAYRTIDKIEDYKMRRGMLKEKYSKNKTEKKE